MGRNRAAELNDFGNGRYSSSSRIGSRPNKNENQSQEEAASGAWRSQAATQFAKSLTQLHAQPGHEWNCGISAVNSKTTLLYSSALAVIPARPDFSLTRFSYDNNVAARVR